MVLALDLHHVHHGMITIIPLCVRPRSMELTRYVCCKSIDLYFYLQHHHIMTLAQQQSVTSLKSCFKTHAYHPCIHDHLGFLFKTNSKTGASDAHYFMWETITQMPLSIERLFVLNQALLALLLFWLNVGVWIKIYKTNMV